MKYFQCILNPIARQQLVNFVILIFIIGNNWMIKPKQCNKYQIQLMMWWCGHVSILALPPSSEQVESKSRVIQPYNHNQTAPLQGSPIPETFRTPPFNTYYWILHSKFFSISRPRHNTLLSLGNREIFRLMLCYEEFGLHCNPTPSNLTWGKRKSSFTGPSLGTLTDLSSEVLPVLCWPRATLDAHRLRLVTLTPEGQ